MEDAALWNLIGLEWEGKGNSGVYIAHFQLSDLIWRISCLPTKYYTYTVGRSPPPTPNVTSATVSGATSV